jgi:hypothetical protein
MPSSKERRSLDRTLSAIGFNLVSVRISSLKLKPFLVILKILLKMLTLPPHTIHADGFERFKLSRVLLRLPRTAETKY